jgi:excisionase family DNA binding protein
MLHATLGQPSAAGDGASRIQALPSRIELAPTSARAVSCESAAFSGAAVVDQKGGSRDRRGAGAADDPAKEAGPAGIAVAHYRFLMDTSHSDTAQLVPALEQALDRVPSAAIPSLIGDLERLQALLSARLLRETWQAAPGARSVSALEDLQHLTPAQVAELLNLTEPYVHELCRTGRVQATKSGKYWMIPVAGLRRWLTYQNRDIDHSQSSLLESPHQRRDRPASLLTGLARRPSRRSRMA